MELLLEETQIARPVLGALEWSLNEITDNVLTHAGGVDGLVQVTRYGRTAHIVTCDAGRGIGQSMRDAFPDFDDLTAARESIRPGITSGPGQGNGLAGIDSIAKLSGARST
jgi:anti-sigma regulatory factor (Ser/Thr protein kinase)